MPGAEAAIHRAASEMSECHSERYPQFGRGSVRQRAFEEERRILLEPTLPSVSWDNAGTTQGHRTIWRESASRQAG
jgi:hypothetical protein